MRFVWTALFLAFLCVFAVPGTADAREPFLTSIYKSIKGEREPDPSITLRAPFIHPGDMETPTADKMGLPYTYYDNQGTVQSLAAPHRDKDEVSGWLTRVVSEIFTVEPDKYERQLKRISAVMSPNAVSAYDSYLQESNLLNMMRDQRMELHAFVEEEPLLLNKGTVDGRYQWLYIMPATISLLAPQGQDYERKSKEISSSNMRMQLRILVSRTEVGEVIRRVGLRDDGDDSFSKKNSEEYDFEGENSDGLIIESIEIHKNPFAK